MAEVLDKEKKEKMRKTVLEWISDEKRIPDEPKKTPVKSRATRAPKQEMHEPEQQVALTQVAPAPEEEPAPAPKTVDAVRVEVAAPVSSPAPVAVKPRASRHITRRIAMWLPAIYLPLIVLVAGGAVFASEQVRGVVSRVLPVPFGLVGSHPLLLSTFDDDADALRHFYEQQDASTAAIPPDGVLRAVVRETMIRRAVLHDLALQHGVWVSQAEVDGYIAKIIEQSESLEEVERTVEAVWGWNLSVYRRKVIQPYLLKQKVFEALKADPVIGRELGDGADMRLFDAYLDRLSKDRLVEWITVAPSL